MKPLIKHKQTQENKTKSEIGFGGDRNSNSFFRKQNEIGIGGDPNSNSNFQKNKNRAWM